MRLSLLSYFVERGRVTIQDLPLFSPQSKATCLHFLDKMHYSFVVGDNDAVISELNLAAIKLVDKGGDVGVW